MPSTKSLVLGNGIPSPRIEKRVSHRSASVINARQKETAMNFKPRKMPIRKMLRQCGVFITAQHLRNRGYTLQQCFDIIAVNL